MPTREKRGTTRYALRSNVHYEKMLQDNTFDVPMTVVVRDFGLTGISFYSTDKIKRNTPLRMNIFVSQEDFVTFTGRVARVALSEKEFIEKKEELIYVIGVKIEQISQVGVDKLKSFFSKIDISNVLDRVDLRNVMDIHLLVGYPPVIQKIGKLHMGSGQPFDEYVLKSLLLNMLDDDRYNKFITEKELNFVLTTRKGHRFRVNLHVQQGKMEGVFRLIPARIGSPSRLGVPPVVETLLMNKRGLVLVAGRTGSGKTTTLSSMIEYLNLKRSGIILTIEDPIEYVHENQRCIIKQRELGRDTHSFYNAAKNALRQNPDVLVVGEILDMETMETAITAAETGTLVLTSIHAGNAAQTLDRVSSFFSADLQQHILKRLSLILNAVIAQELIPRLDGNGLVLATEVMVVNGAMRRTIRDGDWKQIPSIIQVNKNIGMNTMQDSLTRLHKQGLIHEEYLKEEYAF